MNDKNLREVLSAHIKKELITDAFINLIHIAIVQDKNDEKLFCKSVVAEKLKGKKVYGPEFNTPTIKSSRAKEATARNNQLHKGIEKLSGL